jgi:glycosidase
MKNIFLIILIIGSLLKAQTISVSKIEPPNWWSGMKLNKIQLMIYGENLEGISASFKESSLKVDKVHKTDNPSYLFIDISIRKNASPMNYNLVLKKDKQSVTINFPILKRETGEKRFQGFSPKDVIYLVMPDRFSNGDTSNDSIPEYSDYLSKTPNQARAGGDLQGMINRLDYLRDLGITAIWPTPLVENNTFRSYHGYAATDFYKIDPRLGNNELYKKFVSEAHKRDIKVILDHVANHFSDDHIWMKNPPTKNWTNGTKENHLNANHNKMIFTDLYADSSTIKHVEQGWFVSTMPDLNQENPFVDNYIIQNTIWWMEYANLDGIREDTHPYNNQKFMSKWARTVLNEFSSINIVGEVWTGDPAFLAGYQKDTFLPRSFSTNIPSLTDFGLRDVFVRYLLGQNNLYHFFELLSKDYLYKDPSNLVTFADNHDVARVMFYAKDNIAKAKNVYTILFTTRGIPQIFYGSEIGLVGTDDHGELRIPFPGGFPGDQRNAFEPSGRTDNENGIFNHIKKLISIRKKLPALTDGKLIHFPPSRNVYVYFRVLNNQKVMIIINDNDESKELDLGSYKNMLTGRERLINQDNGIYHNLKDSQELNIEAGTSYIFKVE